MCSSHWPKLQAHHRIVPLNAPFKLQPSTEYIPRLHDSIEQRQTANAAILDLEFGGVSCSCGGVALLQGPRVLVGQLPPLSSKYLTVCCYSVLRTCLVPIPSPQGRQLPLTYYAVIQWLRMYDLCTASSVVQQVTVDMAVRTDGCTTTTPSGNALWASGTHSRELIRIIPGASAIHPVLCGL